jgi:hypothetical protein
MTVMGCCYCPDATTYTYVILDAKGDPVTVTSSIAPPIPVDWEAHKKFWVKSFIKNHNLTQK